MSSTLIILKYWVLQYCVRARILVCLPPAPRERIACARVRFGGGGGGVLVRGVLWRPVASHVWRENDCMRARTRGHLRKLAPAANRFSTDPSFTFIKNFFILKK
jgi:hypothetical protein